MQLMYMPNKVPTKHAHYNFIKYNFILSDVGNATAETCMTKIVLCAYIGLVNKIHISYSTIISRNLEK